MKNGQLHLLILEDEAAHVEAIRRAFDRAAIKPDIQAVGTLREYRECIAASPPDLVLADLNLPDGRATEIFTHPAADAPFPILVMTAFGNERVVVEVMKAGALDYVVKSPEAFAAMPQAVERALREWQLHQKNNQAEAAMIASEARYRRLFETTKDGILILNAATGRIVDVNPYLTELLGYAREVFVGKPIWELGFFKDIAANREKFEELQAKSYVRYDELALETSDRRRIEVEFISNADEVDHYRLIQCNIRDVTERKRADAALRESEGRFQRLLQDIPAVAVQSYGYDGTTHYWNHASELLYGYTAKEAIGKNLLELIIPPEMHTEVQAAIRQMAETGQPIPPAELSLLRKDGSRVSVFSCHAIVQTPGREPELFCLDIDLTERKLIEESLARLATAVEQAAETIVITDTAGTIIYANPAFEKSTGYTRAEAIGQNPRLLKSGKQDAAFYRHLWDKLNRGEVWSGHFKNKRKDGSQYEEEATISPIRDVAGKLTSYVAVKRDVTHEVQLQNQLRQSQKMQAIGTLAGGIAHDFNNILSVIFGYCNLLQLDLAGNAEAMAKLLEILHAGQRAKDLVQQILTFSRQREQERQVIHLESIVKEATRLLRSSLPTNIEVEVNLAADVPTVLADATQIYQVVMNLGTNAMHAMEGQPTGKLTITLDSFQPGEALLMVEPRLRAIRYARLTIADTGHGMDAVTLARIFEPFFTTKAVGKGTGLGLAVVHGIMESHDGVITVASQLNQGTTFRAYFPAQIEDIFLAGLPEDKFFRGQGQRILIVDDEAALIGMYQLFMKALKYEATVIACPEEALRRVEENPAQFDLVITDLTMPKMNGLELTRRIHAVRADLPVILATGFRASVSGEQLRQAGVFELVEKPISITTLAEVLHAILGKK